MIYHTFHSFFVPLLTLPKMEIWVRQETLHPDQPLGNLYLHIQKPYFDCPCSPLHENVLYPTWYVLLRCSIESKIDLRICYKDGRCGIIAAVVADGRAKIEVTDQSQLRGILRNSQPNNEEMVSMMSVDEMPKRMNRGQRKRAGIISDGNRINPNKTNKMPRLSGHRKRIRWEVKQA
jgi:hypothetical protein